MSAFSAGRGVLSVVDKMIVYHANHHICCTEAQTAQYVWRNAPLITMMAVFSVLHVRILVMNVYRRRSVCHVW